MCYNHLNHKHKDLYEFIDHKILYLALRSNLPHVALSANGIMTYPTQNVFPIF